MNRSVSPTLLIKNAGNLAQICCRECGKPIAEAGALWKPFAKLTELSMKDAGGDCYRGATGVVLRLFSCTGCDALLDSETALPGEPFLEDVVFINPEAIDQ